MASNETIRKCLAAIEPLGNSEMTPREAALLTAAFYSKVTDEEAKIATAAAIENCRFRPKPVELWELLNSMDGRPTPDEAWAMVPKSERDSACWTAEMSEAHGVASSLIEAGDLVAARRSFIECYSRLVASARKERRPVSWTVTLGYDKGSWAAALREATERTGIDAANAMGLQALETIEGEPERLAIGPQDVIDRIDAFTKGVGEWTKR